MNQKNSKKFVLIEENFPSILASANPRLHSLYLSSVEKRRNVQPKYESELVNQQTKQSETPKQQSLKPPFLLI